MIPLNFKPQKGKAYDKLPLKTLSVFDHTKYLVSTKYDGNQIFIAKEGLRIRWFTSDWKEFNLPVISLLLASHPEDFILVAEMNYNSVGKLGDRPEVQGKITTERVNFKKGLLCSLKENNVRIRPFELLQFDNGVLIPRTASHRIRLLDKLVMELPDQFEPVVNRLMTGEQAKKYTEELVKEGWEGTMLIDPDEEYYVGKRVNHSIKLKYRPTADLRCINVVEGEGKYIGMIGALVLQDKMGRVVRVGSGLSDSDRLMPAEHFIDYVVEIEYEQIIDTYIQPTFVCIRGDKNASD